jgi:ribosomal protein S18 acetylase RimI-like enzyme
MVSIIPAGRLAEGQRREAFALFFAEADEREARVGLALDAIERGDLDPELILTGWLGSRVAGVLVAEPLKGGGASVWPVRVRPGTGRGHIEDQLIASALAALRDRGVKFAQSFVPPEDAGGGDALARHGFAPVTRMWQMRRDVPPVPPPVHADIVPLADAGEDVFRRALLDTFTDALDCPELNGLRTPEETIAGHRAGAPDLSRWWLARLGGGPAGVLILSESAATDVWEVGYLGVVPAARRRGVGRALADFAVRQAATAGARALMLLVDERNRPAIDLYKKAGFRLVDIHNVYLRTDLFTPRVP